MARDNPLPPVMDSAFVLPPSTLAAQIVQNQTRPTLTRQGEQQSLFATLLHEILHRHDIEEETDVETNVQLVKVLVEAGLNVLCNEQPFASSILVQQAKDSVSVIERTITRQPQILVASVSHDGPPVCLWLLTKTAKLVGSPQTRALPMTQLLTCMIKTLNRSMKLWQKGSAFKSILQDCVEDIAQAFATQTVNTSITIQLPPTRSLSKLWEHADGALVTSHDCQTTTRDMQHAAVYAMQLIAASSAPVVWQEEMVVTIIKSIIRLREDQRFASRWDLALSEMLELDLGPINMVVLCQVSQVLLGVLPPSQELQICLMRAMSSVNGSNQQDQMLARILSRAQQTANFEHLDQGMKNSTSGFITTAQTSTKAANHIQVPSQTATVARNGNKRRKLDSIDSTDKQEQERKRIFQFFSVNENSDHKDFPRDAQFAYGGFDDSRRCVAWLHLHRLARLDTNQAVKTMIRLIDHESMKTNRNAKVLALQAIQACASLSTDYDFLDLKTSVLGRVCLRSLQSSSRDVRIAAGECMPAFVRNTISSDTCASNRQIVLQWLRRLADQNRDSIQETLVPAWGKLARVLDNAELNLALLRLVDYLGHPNALIRGLAFSELQSTAAAKFDTASVEALLTPFWSSIAVSVVQDLVSCPQKAQMLSDLIGKDVNTFLIMTQLHTIPTLVVTKRKDILRRIAAARGASTTVRDLCIQPRANLIAVLSHLVAQAGHDSEQLAASCLNAVDEAFTGQDFADYLKIDSTAIACDLLKHAGEQIGPDKERAHQAFLALAELCERPPGNRKAQPKPGRLVTAFFKRHILGMLTGFTAVIEASTSVKSVEQKTACLHAVAEMIVLAKEEITTALPQTRALLQSAIEQDSLCQTAWTTWLALLPVLEADDIANIMEQTFALVLKHWQAWTDDVQTQTHEVIRKIIEENRSTITEHVLSLPSLTGIPLFSKLGAQIELHKSHATVEVHLRAYMKRLQGENATVILQALKDLIPYLETNQSAIHEATISEQPSQYVADLMRALLDVASALNRKETESAELCGKALGIIGCLDPNRIETSRKQDTLLVLSNFDKADEVVRWVIALLEQYLVKAFRSVTNAQSQGFMAYVIQELLKFCGFDSDIALRPRATQTARTGHRWQEMPENVQITLTPFLSSRYTVTSSGSVNPPKRAYPAFSADASYSTWLRGLVYDLSFKAKGENARMLFPHLARIVRGHDLAIANFLLPYIVLNVILGGIVSETEGLRKEMLAVLGARAESFAQSDTIKLCCETLFRVLDYMSVWLREKRKTLTETRATAYRTGTSPSDFDELKEMGQIETVETFLASIPAEIVADKALECGSFARALFNWEQYIRQTREVILSNAPSGADEIDYHRLYEIYARIEEPDGLEGISEHLSFLSEEEQATLHARSGRWTAAQTWYDNRLARDPEDEALQGALLKCLQETGRFSTLLMTAERFKLASGESAAAGQNLVASVVEAAWMLGDLDTVRENVAKQMEAEEDFFNMAIGKLLVAATDGKRDSVSSLLAAARRSVVLGMTSASTSSLQASHDDLRKLHMLAELEMISDAYSNDAISKEFIGTLEKRLSVVGAHSAFKQSILAIRRNLVQVDRKPETARYAAQMWLASCRLARKQNNVESAYHSLLKASEFSAGAAKLEGAKLLWHDGHHRQAISTLEQARASGVFTDLAETQSLSSLSVNVKEAGDRQNFALAKAVLTQAKWLDRTGQTQEAEMTAKYQEVPKAAQKWEKGHYYLGKHYLKMFEAQRALDKDKQSSPYWCGQLSQKTIENLMRSVGFGNKYWYESIPKLLTLWLDLGAQVHGAGSREHADILAKRKQALKVTHEMLYRYFGRLPPYVWYSALPQMLSRLSHPHPEVWAALSQVIGNIVSKYPNQALWSLMAVTKASDKVRQDRAKEIMRSLRAPDKKDGELRALVASGQRLSDGLLKASEAPVEARATHVSLERDLRFNTRLAPCPLVVPIESTLAMNLPPGSDNGRIRTYKPFVQEQVTIRSFKDNVLVLSSLQRPKKLTLEGSDGKVYGLLCKPKDDLRKDQRLMEFNGIINRALKRDSAASRRRLYIKTYAVTPLSEESGCLEWVDGIKPIRDILLNLYSRRGVRPNYIEIRKELDEACKSQDNLHMWDAVQARFPAALHEWFAELYPEPEAWFAARLRYTRSAAVMSMTGHVLGLGDRHGENILLQESTGGVFHVDFNCLFDKGKTFEKPEVVPFRLTRNMVDAMGPYGHEGPFRKSSEVTFGLLRQNKDTLMTTLETFLYDPTTDFVGKKKKTVPGVPETPREILESVDGKLKGLLRGETMPLSVEGYVDALIKQATSSWNLCHMYIGWCAFF